MTCKSTAKHRRDVDLSEGGPPSILPVTHYLTAIHAQALQGGVTVVQVREKSADTAEVRRLDIRIGDRYPFKQLNSSSK
jgi:thiamine monophosphate synthase